MDIHGIHGIHDTHEFHGHAWITWNQWNPWISMDDPQKILLKSMESMDIHEIHGIHELHGHPRISMDIHGYPHNPGTSSEHPGGYALAIFNLTLHSVCGQYGRVRP